MLPYPTNATISKGFSQDGFGILPQEPSTRHLELIYSELMVSVCKTYLSTISRQAYAETESTGLDSQALCILPTPICLFGRKERYPRRRQLRLQHSRYPVRSRKHRMISGTVSNLGLARCSRFTQFGNALCLALTSAQQEVALFMEVNCKDAEGMRRSGIAGTLSSLIAAYIDIGPGQQ